MGIDPNNPGWWYLAPKGPRGNVHSMWFHIPSNVNCPNDRCTVQFTWKTANSCNPHPAAYCNYYRNVVGPQNTWCDNWYCGSFCTSGSSTADNCEATTGNRLCCSEVFTNCAEVKLVEEGGSATHATPAPTAAPTTSPSQIEPEPEPEPEPEAEAEPEPSPQPEPTQTPPEGSSCIGEPCTDPTHCRSKWGSCGSSAAYCNADSTWTANGCLSLIAHRHVVVETRTPRRHRRFLGTSLMQASSNLAFGKSLPAEDL